jgi:hypothetical protein
MRYNRRILEAFMRVSRLLLIACATVVTVSLTAAQQPAPAPPAAPAPPPNPKLDQYKRDVGLEVDAMQENIQKMNDTVFSFAEPGFQEFETSKYLTGILKAERLHDPGEPGGDPDGVDGDVGQRQAGDRARLRHRRHPAGVAEARRRLARADHRRRARARRGDTTRGCRSRSRPRSP